MKLALESIFELKTVSFEANLLIHFQGEQKENNDWNVSNLPYYKFCQKNLFILTMRKHKDPRAKMTTRKSLHRGIAINPMQRLKP